MKPSELKKLREKVGATYIELACFTGLPSDYLRQIEEEKVIALDTDLERIENALRRLQRNSHET